MSEASWTGGGVAVVVVDGMKPATSLPPVIALSGGWRSARAGKTDDVSARDSTAVTG